MASGEDIGGEKGRENRGDNARNFFAPARQELTSLDSDAGRGRNGGKIKSKDVGRRKQEKEKGIGPTKVGLGITSS